MEITPSASPVLLAQIERLDAGRQAAEAALAAEANARPPAIAPVDRVELSPAAADRSR
jgi:hypothetical protein